MKKLYTLLLALIAFVAGAQGDNLVGDNQEVALGDQISTIYELQTAINANNNQLFILQNYGNKNDNKNSYYTYGTSEIGLTSSVSNYTPVKLVLAQNSDNTYTITVQAYDGNYYQNPANENATAYGDGTKITTASTKTSFGFSLADASQKSFWFTATVGTNTFHLNAEDVNSTPMAKWYPTSGTGQYSRTLIYKANITEASQQTFTLNAYYAPEGTTYKIGDRDLTVTDDNNDGIGTGTFNAYPSQVTSDYVTVSAPDGYSAFTSVSGTDFIVNFAPTVVGTTKYYSTNNPATEIKQGQWYLLYQSRNPGYAYNKNGTYYIGQQSNFSNGTEVTNSNSVYLFQFYPTGEQNQYYIMSADGKFFGSAAQGTAISATNTRTAYNVVSTGHSDGFYFYMQDASSNIIIDNNAGFSTVVGWGNTAPSGINDSGHNNVWRFFPVSDTQITHTVTWNINYTDGDETKTVSVSQTVIDGETATAPSYAFTTIYPASVANITEDKTGDNAITATATFSTPFTASTEGNETWYWLYNPANSLYAYYNSTASNDYNVALSTTKPGTNEAYQWAFFGNPIDGYSIKNKSSNMYAAASDGTAANSGHAILSETAATWTLTEGKSETYSNSFGFGLNGVYLNSYGGSTGYFGFYNQSATQDGGSNWQALTIAADYTDLESALATANLYTIGSGLGKYTDANNAFENAKTSAQNIEKDKANNTEASYQTKIDNAVTGLNNAIAGLTLNMPSTGTFLKLQGAASKGYLTANATNSTDNMKANTTPNNAAIWYYGEDGLISYTAGQYLGTQKALSASATSATIVANPHYIGKYGVRTGENRYVYSVTADGDIDRGTGDITNNNMSNQGYAWNLEEVDQLPVTMHQAGDNKYYATVCLPVAVTVPTGTTAYYVSKTTAPNGETNGTATLTEFTDKVIPANTAAVLIGSSESISLTVGGTASEVSGNILSGSFAAIQANSNDYYFGQSDGAAGFYKASGTLPYISNRAYLTATSVEGSTTGGSKGFTFVFGGDDDPTGIQSATESADTFDADAVRYNLQGQRVGKDYKGIIVVNGKKYLVR